MLFSRNTARQHAYISEAVTPYSTWLELPVSPEAIATGSSTALRMLDLEITRQAMTIAYINDFKLMMWLVLALVPLVFVLNSTKPKVAA